MSDELQNQPEPAEFLFYQTEDGQTRLEVAFRGETCWLSLNQLAELFQRDKSVISRHIKNLFEEGELESDSTVAKFATVQTEGEKKVSRQTTKLWLLYCGVSAFVRSGAVAGIKWCFKPNFISYRRHCH